MSCTSFTRTKRSTLTAFSAHFYGSYGVRVGELGMPDQPAFDFDGEPLFGSDGRRLVSYGIGTVLSLAKKDNKLATHNADSYCQFAVAM